MLYGFSTGFGSPQVSVADILARAVPTLHSPSHKSKSSNFLQVNIIYSKIFQEKCYISNYLKIDTFILQLSPGKYYLF